MTQRDFDEFAEQVKHAGIATPDAMAKFKLALWRCGAPKKRAPKKTIRIVVDGVRIYPDGHERCITDAAWLRRREELFERANACCENPDCFRPLLFLGAMHAHHVRKRSVGLDDRLSNLLGLCEPCHGKVHDPSQRI